MFKDQDMQYPFIVDWTFSLNVDRHLYPSIGYTRIQISVRCPYAVLACFYAFAVLVAFSVTHFLPGIGPCLFVSFVPYLFCKKEIVATKTQSRQNIASAYSLPWTKESAKKLGSSSRSTLLAWRLSTETKKITIFLEELCQGAPVFFWRIF